MKIDTVNNFNINLGGASLPIVGALLASIFAAAPSQAPSQPAPAASASGGILTPTKLGEYWSGQGGIYVGIARGFDGQPDAHVILATDPRSMFEARSIGTYGVDVNGATSDHDGLANTIALAEAGSELCKEIRALEIDGHKDFALMSRQDARLCMANVPEQFEKEWYLTSTQASSHYAWHQHFHNGRQSYYYEKFEARARLVRRLVL